MARVLHLITGDIYAGAERVQDLLALRLPALGHHVSFLCLKPGRFAQERQAQDAPLRDAPMRGRWVGAVAHDIAHAWPAGHFDLVHSHTLRSGLVAQPLSRAWGVPHVHQVHSASAHDTEHRLRNRVNAWVERHFVLARADQLVCVADTLRQRLTQQGMAGERVHVVANGVPEAAPVAFAPDSPAEWVISTTALLRPRKGVEVLLKTVQQLRQAGLPVSVQVIGPFSTPAYEQQLRQLSERLGLSAHVRWLGATRDVLAALRQSHLFCLPSLYGEGLPMALLEAMSLGLPCVASAVDGVPAALAGGQAGQLVPPGDASALTHTLAALMADPVAARRLGHAGWQRQRSHFTDTRMAREMAEVYEQVLARHAGRCPR